MPNKQQLPGKDDSALSGIKKTQRYVDWYSWKCTLTSVPTKVQPHPKKKCSFHADGTVQNWVVTKKLRHLRRHQRAREKFVTGPAKEIATLERDLAEPAKT